MGEEPRHGWRKFHNIVRAVNQITDESGNTRGGSERRRSDKPPEPRRPEESQQQPYTNNPQVSAGQVYSGYGAPHPQYQAQGFSGQGHQAQPGHGSGFGHSPPQDAYPQSFDGSSGPQGYPAASQGYPPYQNPSAVAGPHAGHAQSYYDQHPHGNSQGWPEHPYGYGQNPPHNAHAGFPPDRPGPQQSQSDYDANTQQYHQNQGFGQYPPDPAPALAPLRRMDTAPAASTYEHHQQPHQYNQDPPYTRDYAGNTQHSQNQGFDQYPPDSASTPAPVRRIDTAPAAMSCIHGTRSDMSCERCSYERSLANRRRGP